MESINDYYIHNFKLLESSNFDEKILKEGTSIYEVIRIENTIPLFLENHLNRLFHSADISNLNIDLSYCDIEILIEQLIKKNKVLNGKIKIVALYNSNNKSEKELLIYFTPHYFPTKFEILEGVNIGICKVTRTNPNAKILNTKARAKADKSITKKKLFEVLLQNDAGYITEGSRSNIFFIKNNTIFTPPENDILMGITRNNIISVCNQYNINIIEKKIHSSEISEMDSAFISGTSLKVLPVRCIETQIFNTRNSILMDIITLYDAMIEEYVLSKLS
ncbi:MAG: aminotransferase class IV [Bacteroidales bacterium]|nr:aminotransferase class IV [Bacteroidales bacterium]